MITGHPSLYIQLYTIVQVSAFSTPQHTVDTFVSCSQGTKPHHLEYNQFPCRKPSYAKWANSYSKKNCHWVLSQSKATVISEEKSAEDKYDICDRKQHTVLANSWALITKHTVPFINTHEAKVG